MSDSAQKDIEALAILQAVYKAIGEEIGTGVPDNLRGRVNEYYRGLYETTGATGFNVRIGDTKVGTFGFNKVKGEPERTVRVLRITDTEALMEWIWHDGDDFRHWLDAALEPRLPEFAIQYAEETGELPRGIELVESTIPGRPEGIRPNGTLRIKKEMMERARAALAGGGLAGLLGGGE